MGNKNGYDLVCKRCGKVFHHVNKNKVYCSDECKKAAKKHLICPICGKEFIQKAYAQKYCSEECHIKAKNMLARNRFVEQTKIDFTGIEGIDYIECKICGQRMSQFHQAHLDMHGISREEYEEKYGKIITYPSKYIEEHFAGENNPNHSSKVNEQIRKERSPFSKKFYEKRGLTEEDRKNFTESIERELEQYIKYHVNIDFKRFNYLAESMKHIDDIDIYADAITKKLLNFIESSKTNKIDLSKLIIYKNDIPLKSVFFDEIHFEESFFLINSNEKTPAEMSGYLPDKSGIIDDDGNKKYIVTLKIDTITSLDYIKESYPFLFAHEIAHAYEDFCKHSNIKIEDKTSDEVKFIPGYVYKALTDENDRLIHFAGILYFSFDSEVVAMKNEIFQELYARRHGMRDLTLANEQLKKTRVYKRMLTIEEYVNDLEKIIDDDTQIKLINLYNKTFCSHITNYDDLLIKVNTKYLRARNKIISAAGNAVYFGYAMRNKVWDY